MAWEGINRRRFPRANYTCTVTVRHKGSTETFHTKTENVGCGGICVILPKEIRLFSPVELKLDLGQGNKVISCDGTIVWCVGSRGLDDDDKIVYDTGIEFFNIKEKDRVLFEGVVKECLQKSKS